VDVRVVVVWKGADGIRCRGPVRTVASRSRCHPCRPGRCRPASGRSACRARRLRPRWLSVPRTTARTAAAVA